MPGHDPSLRRPLCVLVVHERYRVRGGEDGVFETECSLLEKAGHKVVRYEKDNRDIPDRGGRIGLALRTIWNPRTYREIRSIIRAEKPDVVHCHNTFPLISPSVYWAAAREGVPVVQTLHNYRLACLNGYLFREGHVCEDCLGRTPWRGVCRRCYRDSRAQSFVAAAMLLVHRLLGTYRRKVTRYIALTDFAKTKFVEAGLPARKISVKPNAFAAAGGEGAGLPATVERSGASAPDRLRVIFLGRLSPEKGVDILLRAWAMLCNASGGNSRPAPSLRGLPPQAGGGVIDHCSDDVTCEQTVFVNSRAHDESHSAFSIQHSALSVIGDGPERATLEGLANDLGISSSVRFLGALPREEALRELAGADLLVFPSLWYEQFAITPLEAMALGVPVLVSDVARGATIVEDGVTGRFFPAGDPSALAAALRELLSDSAALRRMGDAARAAFEASDCAPSRNLARLLEVYASARSAHDA